MRLSRTPLLLVALGVAARGGAADASQASSSADGSDGDDASSCGCGAATDRASIAGASSSRAAQECSLSSDGDSCSADRASPVAPRPSNTVVLIPAGSAVLGTDTPHFPADGEGPSFPFRLPSPLFMDKHEVSNARFAGYVNATGYVTEAESYGWSFVHELAVPRATLAGITQSAAGAEWWVPVPNATWFAPEGVESDITRRMDHPAVHVSQRDAARFCAWAGGRLPTEDEWEYAARGGKEKRLFPWGNQLVTGGRHRANIWQGKFPYNNTGEDGYAWTAPVDSFEAQNGWGLYHMSGNVWEWTASRWCPLQPARSHRQTPECARARRQPRGAQPPEDEGEVDHVKRGGSFLCHIDSCYRYRAAARHKNTANSSAQNLGFRCVYDARPTRENVVVEQSPDAAK